MVPLKVVVSEFAVGITYTVMGKFYKKLISKRFFFVFQFKKKPKQKQNKKPQCMCALWDAINTLIKVNILLPVSWWLRCSAKEYTLKRGKMCIGSDTDCWVCCRWWWLFLIFKQYRKEPYKGRLSTKPQVKRGEGEENSLLWPITPQEPSLKFFISLNKNNIRTVKVCYTGPDFFPVRYCSTAYWELV